MSASESGERAWSGLNRMQLGQYAEYFVKMEFTLHGLSVFTAEVDDRGIDFVIRTPSGEHYDVQVKSSCRGNYVFMQKDKFPLGERLLLALVLFTDGEPPELFLIPSTAWLKPNELFKDREYEGKKSKPEWGLELAKKHRPLLEQYAFAEGVARLS